MNISIGKKLFLAIALLFALMIGTFGISIYKQIKSTKLSSEVADHWLPAVSKVSELNVNVSNYRRMEVLMTLAEEKTDQEAYRESMDSALGNLTIYRKVFEPFLQTAEQNKLYEEFSKEWDKYTETHDKIEAFLAKGENSKAHVLLLGESQAQFQNAYELMQKLGNACFESGVNSSKKAREEFENSKYVILGAMLLSLVLGGLLMFKITRTMIRSLRAISEGILGSTEQVNSSSEILSKASNTFSHNISSAALSIENTVASMEELSSIAKNNTVHAQDAANKASECHSSVTQGQVKIQALIEAMNENYKNSARMQEMLSLVDDIAFQTNLLALNAAVEAARAGEQGRGFAVVADAVRSLAQKSAIAAKDINEVLKENLTGMKKGVGLAAEGEVAFKAIVEYVAKIRQINEAIALGSQEQNVGVEQIAKAMSTIDTTSQANAKTSQDLGSTASLVKTEADRLNEMVLQLEKVIYGNVNKNSKEPNNETDESMSQQKHA